MIEKIGCVEIPVSDMERAVSFYENVLKLKKAYEHPVWTSFGVGGTSFALALSGTKGKKERTEICTSCSLCVLRYSKSTKSDDESPTTNSVIYLEVGDLNMVYRELRDKGVLFLSGPTEQAWGGKTAVMLDPDKNILVLSQTN